MEEITDETIHIHQLQATTKKITIIREMEESLMVFADRDMVNPCIQKSAVQCHQIYTGKGNNHYPAEK